MTDDTDKEAPRRMLDGIPLRGVLSESRWLKNQKNEEYFWSRFSYTDDSGAPRKVTAMAFGEAAAKLRSYLGDGEKHLFGGFQGAVFRIVKRGRDARGQRRASA